MQALVLTAPRQFELHDIPVPVPAPDQVLVRIAACGICGSDVHGMDGSTGRRRPPIIMGHEAAGAIAEIGAHVSGWAINDRVTFDSTVYCGACPFCLEGRVNLCDARRVLGVSCDDYRQHGAFAEYLAVPARILYRLPAAVPFHHAAMVEPVSIAVHAVARAGVRPTDYCAVIGAGMIGLLVIQALRAHGCTRIVAVDIDDRRLDFARQFGASTCINATAVDVPAAIRDLCGGLGAHAAFEVVGTARPFNDAVQCVRKGGSVTLVGNLAPTVDAPLQAIVTRELALYGSCASAGEYPACLDLMASGAIDVAPLISARAALSSGAQWFHRLYDREPGLMKVILEPQGVSS